ncbi:MAG: hypothetical protein QXU40_01900 [Candidatus Pacearchaeota archaeon]
MEKRFESAEAQEILKDFKRFSIEELNKIFGSGTLFLFEEIRGKTAGSFLAWKAQNPAFVKFGTKLLFESPFGCWIGKEFIKPFSREEKGFGVNLFNNFFLPKRFWFKTYFKNSFFDGNPCLALDYRPYKSLMFGLVDDVRKIKDGIFLGQMYFKFPFKKNFQFLGYFLLAL